MGKTKGGGEGRKIYRGMEKIFFILLFPFLAIVVTDTTFGV